MTQHFRNTRNRNKGKKRAHKPTNIYYTNMKQGRSLEKYTVRRDIHNHYIHIKN
jgi:hypothetical protein